jgi:hypothetical protein
MIYPSHGVEHEGRLIARGCILINALLAAAGAGYLFVYEQVLRSV